MIEIISGPIKRNRKEFTCFNCGTIYQADKWNYEYWDPNGEWGYRIPCPVCGDKTWHKEIGFYDKIDEPIELKHYVGFALG